jgi:hypothetical protein
MIDWIELVGVGVSAVSNPPNSNLISQSQQKILTMMKKFTSCILLVLCATVSNVAVNARRRVISTTALSSTSNILRRRGGDALKNPSFDVRKHTLISEEVVKDVRGGQGGGTATMSSEMFNMVKAVVGVGVLSLPAGKLSMFLCGPSYY